MRDTDKSHLHPSFRQKLGELEAKLATEGIPLQLYEGARTPFRQAELYARGRTSVGSTVTRATAWTSFHQYGVAADYVFMVDGKWTWNEQKPGQWKRYGELCHLVGLERLDFEQPHVQLIYPLSHLRRGAYPLGGDATWETWLETQISLWGSFSRDMGGILHPGAPPPLDIHERPALSV